VTDLPVIATTPLKREKSRPRQVIEPEEISIRPVKDPVFGDQVPLPPPERLVVTEETNADRSSRSQSAAQRSDDSEVE
jgi:hypothetical protein